jgi:hypothetical protein
VLGQSLHLLCNPLSDVHSLNPSTLPGYAPRIVRALAGANAIKATRMTNEGPDPPLWNGSRCRGACEGRPYG